MKPLARGLQELALYLLGEQQLIWGSRIRGHLRVVLEYMVKQRTDGGSGHTPAHRPRSLCWELCVLMSSLSHCGLKFHDSRALGTFAPLIQCSVLTAEAVPGTNPPE